jgi:hypothetical protein
MDKMADQPLHEIYTDTLRNPTGFVKQLRRDMRHAIKYQRGHALAEKTQKERHYGQFVYYLMANALLHYSMMFSVNNNVKELLDGYFNLTPKSLVSIRVFLTQGQMDNLQFYLLEHYNQYEQTKDVDPMFIFQPNTDDDVNTLAKMDTTTLLTKFKTDYPKYSDIWKLPLINTPTLFDRNVLSTTARSVQRRN